MAQSLAEAREELELHNAELEAQGAQLAGTVGELELEKARIETFHDVVSAFAAEVELDRLGPLLLNKLRSVAGARGGALYVADPMDASAGSRCTRRRPSTRRRCLRASRPTPSSASSSATCCSRSPAPAGRSAS